MFTWFKKNFADYGRAKSYAARQESIGRLTVITPHSYGWTVSWANRPKRG